MQKRYSISAVLSLFLAPILILVPFTVPAIDTSTFTQLVAYAQSPIAQSFPYPELTIDGIECDIVEHLTFHTHTNLTIFVDDKKQNIPKGIGINQTKCIYWLHTHDDSGLIHVESPTNQNFTLGQFLSIWNRFNSDNSPYLAGILSGNNTGSVKIFVNNVEQNNTNYKDLILKDRDQISLHFDS